MDSLETRLRHAVEQVLAEERERAIDAGPGPFVRLHFAAIVEAHRQLRSWQKVADILAQQGLRWRSGQPLTAHQLRTIISQTRKVSKAREEPDEAIPFADARPIAPQLTTPLLRPAPSTPLSPPSLPSVASVQPTRASTTTIRRGLAELLDDQTGDS